MAKKAFPIIQSALSILIAVLLAAGAIRIFLTGSAYQAAGHPSEWIYTREKAIAALLPALPLFLASCAMTVFGLVCGLKEGGTSGSRKPVPSICDISPGAAQSRTLLRRVLLIAAVIFILLGTINGSMKDVLVKATKICTECIGLG